MKGTYRNVLAHLLGIVLFLSIPILISPDLLNLERLFTIPPFLRDFFTYLLLLGFFYLNYYLLIPKFYQHKKYLIYIFIVVGCYLFAESLPRLFIRDFHVQKPQMHEFPPTHFPHVPGPPMHESHNHEMPPPDFHQPPQGHRPPPFFMKTVFWIDLSRHFFLFTGVLFFSLMLKINERLKLAHKEKINAELSYLKAQINPHFLFNTLNSIYSLAIQKSDDTANAVVKLSGMMRYVLTESQNEFVSLQKELNYISDYIELQKMRWDANVRLNFKISGDAVGKNIAPLVLIPFIENAFKYGINPEENSEITIEIGINEAAINLFVKNNKVSVRPDPENKSGLGIENTKSRLQLMYPGKHYLTIDDNPATFSVSLSIKA